MPLVKPAPYLPPRLLRNRHLHTIFPTLFRWGDAPAYQRQRIDLPDGDFIDLDWLANDHDRVAILCHGLEGCSQSTYMRGMASALNQAGWDVVAFNFRGCSGEPNRLARFYHSGATDDLTHVINAVLATGRHQSISLVGFSLGGNLVLKYLGERGNDLPAAVQGAAALSAPIDLGASAVAMGKPQNRIYSIRFLRLLKQKVLIKHQQHPQKINLKGFKNIRNLISFDDRYTAPLHGFNDATDYYTRCSSLQFLSGIRRPALLLNALDDSFLTPECYPHEVASTTPWLHLQTPEYGGHVGFVSSNLRAPYWSEQQVTAFLQTL